ncbi:MAG: hypothetical protein ACI4O3_02290 [Oscillospiraceae bacterium]
MAEQGRCTVCVSCGIHYDAPDRAGLDRVVASADALLEELCRKIQE